MNLDLRYTEEVAVFIARVFLGLLFFFQGYDAIFRVKLRGVVQAFHFPLISKGVPNFFIVSGVYFTSYIQFICGILLVIGFAKCYALCLLGFDVLLAALAFGVIKPMWDMQFVFPRLALIIFLLIVPKDWDIFSLDYFFSVINKK